MTLSRFLQPLAYAFQSAEIAYRTIAERVNQILNNFGQWLIPVFAAANFSANGSMTWTVIAAGVTTYSYTLVGRTMLFSFNISGTVGGTVNTLLQIAIPDGYTASQAMSNDVLVLNGGTFNTSLASVAVNGTIVQIQAAPAGGNWTAGTASVQGQLTLQVN